MRGNLKQYELKLLSIKNVKSTLKIIEKKSSKNEKKIRYFE